MGAPRADDVLRDLGLRVAELRASRGWTQERFAEDADVMSRQVARISRFDHSFGLPACFT